MTTIHDDINGLRDEIVNHTVVMEPRLAPESEIIASAVTAFAETLTAMIPADAVAVDATNLDEFCTSHGYIKPGETMVMITRETATLCRELICEPDKPHLSFDLDAANEDIDAALEA